MMTTTMIGAHYSQLGTECDVIPSGYQPETMDILYTLPCTVPKRNPVIPRDLEHTLGAHNPKVASSNLAPATKYIKPGSHWAFLVL